MTTDQIAEGRRLIEAVRKAIVTDGKPIGRHMIESQRMIGKHFTKPDADDDARDIGEVALCMASCIENEANLFDALKRAAAPAADLLETLLTAHEAALERVRVLEEGLRTTAVALNFYVVATGARAPGGHHHPVTPLETALVQDALEAANAARALLAGGEG